MEQREQPIGVFDSGLGGISVLRACTALLPQEDFLFFGDSANAPYGEKSLAQVRRLTIAAVDRLLAQGVIAVVVACNTATSAAIHLLRQAHPDLPIIGIEPAVKPAALDVGSSSVIVMATPLTIREDKYQKLAAAFCHEANVISLPCPGLAEMVEGGLFDGPCWTATSRTSSSPFAIAVWTTSSWGAPTTPSSAGPSPGISASRCPSSTAAKAPPGSCAGSWMPRASSPSGRGRAPSLFKTAGRIS